MAGPYYALITSLPELSINDKSLDYDMISFRKYVQEEIDQEDFHLLCILYYPFDILNFVNLCLQLDKPWHEAGNLTETEMEEGIQMPELLPVFFQEFFDEHNNEWKEYNEKELINAVTSSYLDWSRKIKNSFVKKWISFDQNLKNLLIWLNAKKSPER